MMWLIQSGLHQKLEIFTLCNLFQYTHGWGTVTDDSEPHYYLTHTLLRFAVMLLLYLLCFHCSSFIACSLSWPHVQPIVDLYYFVVTVSPVNTDLFVL
jgi:hypothetical protein